jgi:outer membrane protein
VNPRLRIPRPAARFSAAPLVLGLLAVAPRAHAERLTIEDVARLVITSGPELAATRERAQAAVEVKNGSRGRLLPSIHVSDEYQHWDSPFQFPATTPGAPPLTVRERDINTFSVGASQPLVGLFKGVADYRGKSTAADAAAQGLRASESSAREAVELEFLRYFEAKTRGEVARASEQELAQQVAETEARVNAGTLTKADLLRVKVAESTARQDGIVADSNATVARATLLAAIGRAPDDASVELVSPTALLALGDMPAPAPDVVEGRRAEIAQAKLRAEAADHEASARTYAMLPDVNLEAGYAHVNGQIFMPQDSAFVGVKADWAIWEWGSTYSAKEAAAAEARAATLEVDATRRRVRAEVTGRKAELTAAASAVALAKETVVSAEEAFRVTTALVRVGSGTTTDLLNAESALTQARLSLERARYARAASRIRLERAAGLR